MNPPTLLLFLAAGLLAGCQTDGADTGQQYQGSLFGGVGVPPAITLPPKKYDKPCPNCEVFEFNYWEVHKRCTGSNPSLPQRRIEACYKIQGPWHIIIVPEVGTGGITQAQRDALLRHETGHYWGWARSHEGARYRTAKR